jgi:hypothetical protein
MTAVDIPMTEVVLKAKALYEETSSWTNPDFPFYSVQRRAGLVQRVKNTARKVDSACIECSPDYFAMLYLDVAAVRLDIQLDFGKIGD